MVFRGLFTFLNLGTSSVPFQFRFGSISTPNQVEPKALVLEPKFTQLEPKLLKIFHTKLKKLRFFRYFRF